MPRCHASGPVWLLYLVLGDWIYTVYDTDTTRPIAAWCWFFDSFFPMTERIKEHPCLPISRCVEMIGAAVTVRGRDAL
jgi:hypothetical protein